MTNTPNETDLVRRDRNASTIKCDLKSAKEALKNIPDTSHFCKDIGLLPC